MPERPCMTHEEVARELGISKARVQQIERRALAKVRSRLGVDGLPVLRQLDGRPIWDRGPAQRRPLVTAENTTRAPRRWTWSQILRAPANRRCRHCGVGVLAVDSDGNEYCRRTPGVDP